MLGFGPSASNTFSEKMYSAYRSEWSLAGRVGAYLQILVCRSNAYPRRDLLLQPIFSPSSPTTDSSFNEVHANF